MEFKDGTTRRVFKRKTMKFNRVESTMNAVSLLLCIKGKAMGVLIKNKKHRDPMKGDTIH